MVQKCTQDGQGACLNPKVHEGPHAHEVSPSWAEQEKPLCSQKSSSQTSWARPKEGAEHWAEAVPRIFCKSSPAGGSSPSAPGSWLLPTPTPRSPPWQPLHALREIRGGNTRWWLRAQPSHSTAPGAAAEPGQHPSSSVLVGIPARDWDGSMWTPKVPAGSWQWHPAQQTLRGCCVRAPS